MPVPSRVDLLETATTFAEGHDCPYAESLIRADDLRRQFGSYGINLSQLSHLVGELGDLHADDTCPPTHVGTGPTREWAEWVKDVQI